MRLRLVLLLAVSGLVACQKLGAAKVVIVFENETRTKCVKVSARTTAGNVVNAAPLNREPGDDTLVVGISENEELRGELTVTVQRHASRDCTDAAFDTEAQTVTLERNKVAEVRFTFGTEPGDGGTDAGVDAGTDAGTDGGCDTSACVPGVCETGTPACGCVYTKEPAGTVCDGGFCNAAGSCGPNPCDGRPNGTTCNDGLDCTTASSCQSSVCTGTTCSNATIPECNRYRRPLACDSVATTDCQVEADPTADLTSCQTGRGLCLAGSCQRWFNFPTTNLHTTLPELPGLDAGWELASPDGGPCDTIISTSPVALVRSDCGAPNLLTTRVDDAGVRVFGMASLTVGPNARLSFVGPLPAQLLVVGPATVEGVVSVAPLVPGQDLPAGSQSAFCSAVGAGDASERGGGGGGFGGNGGRGGHSGGLGGTATSAISPLRGGCAGGAGFALDGGSFPGGVGGGALQLIVADTLTVNGPITASGAGGRGADALDHLGGGGGGSGGMVILEARTIVVGTTGWVTANGGGGGEGGDTTTASAPPGATGATGPIDSVQPGPVTSVNGGGNGGAGGARDDVNGADGLDPGGGKGGGGGGGSAGVIYLRAATTCTGGTNHLSGAMPTSFSCN